VKCLGNYGGASLISTHTEINNRMPLTMQRTQKE